MKFLAIIITILVFQLTALCQDKAQYEILSEKCSSDNKCSVLAYVKPQLYIKSNMERLAKELASKYKDREVVNFNVFDDKEIIEAFLEGNRNPNQIQVDRRAYFLHIAECGDLLFYKPEKNKLEVVNLGWKKTNKCSEPIMI